MSHPIKRALISVSDKSGLDTLAQALQKHQIEIISTGGTAKALQSYGCTVTDISAYTGFPEMMDGRVKTLHPKVHGGLLARLDNDQHRQSMEEHDIESIDLVIVNLYPFEQTIARGASFEECIENIDIGGPSMVRSAAKNFEFTAIVTDPSDYDGIITTLDEHKGTLPLDVRKNLAAKAFSRTAAYDSAISNWFATQCSEEALPETLHVTAKRIESLRYGENPHQQASLYTLGNDQPSLPCATQLQGKALSYNNINDTDAAFRLVSEFKEPAVAIIKHANPCGVAVSDSLEGAFNKALACDPVSAFGGIIALNQALDAATATAIAKMFVEVVIAPSIDDEAASILSTKKNLRLLSTGGLINLHEPDVRIKSITNGLLVQESDHKHITEADLKVVTKRAPTEEELKDLLFTFSVCKHVKSNAIVLGKDQSTIGVGAGQMSRVDSVRIATLKASEGENPDRTKGSVMASDAFFPFADGILQGIESGVRAVIQPGGSIRDEEVIAAADEHDIAMVFTGVRHFNH